MSEASYSCWSKGGSLGSPTIDIYGYALRIHLSAFEYHNYIVKMETFRLFMEASTYQATDVTD